MHYWKCQLVYWNDALVIFTYSLKLTGSGAGVIGEAGVGDAGGEEDEPPQKPIVKKKKKAGRTHKVGCTATIIMKEVIYYPEFQVKKYAFQTDFCIYFKFYYIINIAIIDFCIIVNRLNIGHFLIRLAEPFLVMILSLTGFKKYLWKLLRNYWISFYIILIL